jgi:hypothetical protein
MLTSLRLRSLALFIALGSPLFAASLDFPSATSRIQIGAQTTHFTAAQAGRDVLVDGKPALAGERLNSLMRVNWVIAPVEGIGDEYVFVVRRPGQKPKTYSVVFKGGYTQVAIEDRLGIEIED